MKLIVVGLGKMGRQIALKLQAAGHEVRGVVRRTEQAEQLRSQGLDVTTDRRDLPSFFGNDQPVVWLMIPEANVSDELEFWHEVLPKNSIIIDGGNTNFTETKRRALAAHERGFYYLDVGTSGGIHGLAHGFSLMIGGERSAYHAVEPLLKALAAPAGAYHHCGESGSGHYVKMVHNAIEYGMMQSLAEGYRMLDEGSFAGQLDLAAAGEVWQHGSVVSSWLNQLAAEALSDNPTLGGVKGIVAESGETRWTLEDADRHDIDVPVIRIAFDVRIHSQHGETNFATKLLAAMRHKFGGHEVDKL